MYLFKSTIIVIMLIFGCSTGGGSMEFTSAKTAARTEKDLNKAELWGVKALHVKSDSTNALVPYFLAVEVYRKQNPPQWEKMAEMFNEAIRRNSEQKLETPKYLIDPEKITKENYKESIAETIQEGVDAYREQEWINVYNKSLDYLDKDNIEAAIKHLEIAKMVDINNEKNYVFLSQIYLNNKDFENALIEANKGLKHSGDSTDLYTIIGSIHNEQGDLKQAAIMYSKAIEISPTPGPIMRQLSFIYIDLGETEKAINLSKSLIEKYSEDPDLYYNLAVIYQRISLDEYYSSIEKFNNLMNANEQEKINQIPKLYNDFLNSRGNAKKSRVNFLSSSDLSIDEKSAKDCSEASKEMRKIIRQIDDALLPSLVEESKKLNIILE